MLTTRVSIYVSNNQKLSLKQYHNLKYLLKSGIRMAKEPSIEKIQWKVESGCLVMGRRGGRWRWKEEGERGIEMAVLDGEGK